MQSDEAKEDLEFFIKKCYEKPRVASGMVKEDTDDCQGILKNDKE